MLKVKRTFSEMCLTDSEPPPPCSPHRIEFLGSPSSPSPSSFSGFACSSSSSSSSSPQQYSPSFRSNPSLSAKRPCLSRPPTYAESLLNNKSSERPSSILTIEKYIKKKERKNSKTKRTDYVFTVDDVKDIVQRALQEREDELREEYTTILQERMQEQFNTFSRFNQDYIAHRLKENDHCSYMS